MSFRPRRIHVVLGYACNHKCRYCIQMLQDFPRAKPKQVSEETLQTIRRAADAIAPETLKVTLFGGEPLLYDEALITLLCRTERDNIKWKIHSNGELLDSFFVDLFNRFRVKFCLSHDGPQVLKTRGTDVFETNPELPALFNALEDRRVDCVITAHCLDLHATHDFFEQKFGNENWYFNPAFLSNPGIVPKDLLAFDFAAWESTVNRICESAERQILSGDTGRPQAWEAQFVLRALSDAAFPPKENPFIRANERCLVPHVDLGGKLTYCERLEGGIHKAYERVAPPLSPRRAFLDLSLSLHEHCSQCAAFAYCRGQCPVERPSAAPEQCRVLKTFFTACDETFKRLSQTAPDKLLAAVHPFLPAEQARALQPQEAHVDLTDRLSGLAQNFGRRQ